MKKEILSIVVFTLLTLFHPGFAETTQNMINNGSIERGTSNWLGAIDVFENASGEKMICITPENNIIKTRQNIPIDTSKTYRLSGKFKAEGKFSRLLFGFIPQNQSGQAIMPQNVNAIPGTETELADDVFKGQTKIPVKDASKWLNSQKQTFMALNADDSGKDLPNFTISPPVTAIVQKDGTWELTLSGGINFTAKAGTKIRQHDSGSTYLYCCSNTMFSDEKILSGIISGVTTGKNIDTQWRTGTTTAKVLILVLYGKNDTGKIMFSDIKLEEIPAQSK